MHILLGAILGVVLLWGWLIGHWFARVLVFLLLACVGAIAGVIAANNGTTPTPPAGVAIFALVGAALGWPLAGLPTYYWRGVNRRYLEAKQAQISRGMDMLYPR